jgi:hypothetical protein
MIYPVMMLCWTSASVRPRSPICFVACLDSRNWPWRTRSRIRFYGGHLLHDDQPCTTPSLKFLPLSSWGHPRGVLEIGEVAFQSPPYLPPECLRDSKVFAKQVADAPINDHSLLRQAQSGLDHRVGHLVQMRDPDTEWLTVIQGCNSPWSPGNLLR